METTVECDIETLVRLTNLLAAIVCSDERPSHVDYHSKRAMCILAEEAAELVNAMIPKGY